MEHYKIYCPSVSLPDELNEAHVHEDESGLRVLLRPGDGADAIGMRFQRTLAFRRIAEEACVFRFEGNWEKPATTKAVYIVENSSWVAGFSKAELIHYPDPVHYLFLTSRQIVEVLACGEPVFDF